MSAERVMNESTGVGDCRDIQPERVVFCDQHDPKFTTVGVEFQWTCDPITVTDLRFVWWYKLWIRLKQRIRAGQGEETMSEGTTIPVYVPRLHKSNAESEKADTEEYIKQLERSIIAMAASGGLGSVPEDGVPWYEHVAREIPSLLQEYRDACFKNTMAYHLVDDPDSCEDELAPREPVLIIDEAEFRQLMGASEEDHDAKV